MFKNLSYWVLAFGLAAGFVAGRLPDRAATRPGPRPAESAPLIRAVHLSEPGPAPGGRTVRHFTVYRSGTYAEAGHPAPGSRRVVFDTDRGTWYAEADEVAAEAVPEYPR